MIPESRSGFGGNRPANAFSSRCMYLCVVEMVACARSLRANSMPFALQIFVPHSAR
jgi:hypothetical protein